MAGGSWAAAAAAVAIAGATAVSSAGARAAGNPCTTLHMTGKTVQAKAARIVGKGTVAQRDSEHPNECDFFSSTTGHEARVYVWPAAQQTTALGSIEASSFGQTVKKRPLSGLGPGAAAYGDALTFTGGSHFVAVYSYGLSKAQTLAVAKLIHTALT